jgi:predicted RNA-binding Zn-ribbon protein involved in translation (DUF1610 family)
MDVVIEISKCNECNSNFKKGSSEMMALCPECSHYLYEYENCAHEMEQGVCKKCLWDGSVSEYVKSVKNA